MCDTSSDPVDVVLVALGSAGDVYPLLEIARTLRSRQHRVALAVNPFFASVVEATGVKLIEIGSADQYRRILEDPTLWQLGKGVRIAFAEMISHMRPVFEAIATHCAPGRSIVVAPTTALGARLANERLGIRLVNVLLQPILIRSVHEQGIRVPSILHPLLRLTRTAIFGALDRWAFDPLVLPQLNAFRAELDLHALRRPSDRWIYSPDSIIGLFPEWFAAPQPDWPRHVTLAGFPLADRDAGAAVAADAAAFLDAGPAPIVFTLGTAMPFSGRFFEVSIDVCRRLGRRGLFVSAFANQIPRPLPDGIAHVEYASFSALLPRSAAVVHHGGIGTLAQALRAGVPQLVTPVSFDQPDNAARAVRLGVADRLPLRRYRPEAAAKKLEAL